MFVYKSVFFGQLQGVKDELSRKEREHASLQLQAETVKRQHQETLHHVTVLKEQLAAKEKQATMLQADVSLAFEFLCWFSSVYFLFFIPTNNYNEIISRDGTKVYFTNVTNDVTHGLIHSLDVM